MYLDSMEQVETCVPRSHQVFVGIDAVGLQRPCDLQRCRTVSSCSGMSHLFLPLPCVEA